VQCGWSTEHAGGQKNSYWSALSDVVIHSLTANIGLVNYQPRFTGKSNTKTTATDVQSPAEAMHFSSNLSVQTTSKTLLASYAIGTGGVLSPGVKARPGRDPDQ
jgi:hypothetical protein